MLQLRDICKSYTSGDFTQTALNHVSISFRDSEFVTVLGPSGSGKTTLLNIMGGLDHYDAGDLVVDGVSTHEYRDKDWDAFRNDRIGFVFQNYNLIPHQTILQNVELALTLAGIDGAERTERARKSLETVGLSEHLDKLPEQLSGGQMQRVAIARALVNDPDIVLADEPTGALDSHTSAQIMEILSQIAEYRLVIMVTHNPELAETYATRTVDLVDGVVQSDTNPFFPTPEEVVQSEKPLVRTSMGPLTALSLSFTNLMMKKGRTFLTALAGSIGIMGIAAILALANGVNNYIESVEEETLSVYPLQITSTGFDLGSVLATTIGLGDDDAEAEGDPGRTMFDSADTVNESKVVTNMLSSFENNDLGTLKGFIERDGGKINEFSSAIEYRYDVVPQIFSGDTASGARQINPDQTFSALGVGSGSANSTLMSLSVSTDVFGEMPGDSSLIEDQYRMRAGRWPQSYDECLLVLSPNGNIPDLVTYALGLRDHQVLEDMVTAFVNEDDVVAPEDTLTVSYDQLMAVPLKLVSAADYYTYNEERKLWVDRSDDKKYMVDLVNKGEDLHIVGVVQPSSDAKAAALSAGIYYTPDLVRHVIDKAAASDIVQQQLAYPGFDVLSGKFFADEGNDDAVNLDIKSFFTVDENAIKDAFTFTPGDVGLDGAALMAGVDRSKFPELTVDGNALGLDLTDAVNRTTLNNLVDEVLADYANYLLAHQPAEGESADYGALLNDYLRSSEAQQIIDDGAENLVDAAGVGQAVDAAVADALEQSLNDYITALTAEIEKQISKELEDATASLGETMAQAMHIDKETFVDAFKFRMTDQELVSLIASIMSQETHSYDANLVKLGYAFLNKPSAIEIYPKTFEDKQRIIYLLDVYNEEMAKAGQPEKEITYTDVVGTIMSSVSTIVDMVSYVLIAFVAISLIVSSMMIGIITYISVLERRKEIGILRALGASKGDVARVFNAETLIVGLVAGLIGVLAVVLACIPANAIVEATQGVAGMVVLPWYAGVVLVLISMVLSLLAGLFPARSASKRTPVQSLRGE